MFNRSAYWERALAGDIACCRKPDSTPLSADEPSASVSVLVVCSDAEGVVVMFHAYVRVAADGTESIGGSGRPDPKWLRQGDRIFRPGIGDEEHG